MTEDSDDIKKKTEELTSKIKKSEEELGILRKTCKHSEYGVKDVGLGAGTLKLKRICSFCEKDLGYPSKQELIDNGYS